MELLLDTHLGVQQYGEDCFLRLINATFISLHIVITKGWDVSPFKYPDFSIFEVISESIKFSYKVETVSYRREKK